MPRNPYVRIALVIVLALILYYLVITLARGVANADDDPAAAGRCVDVVRIHRGLQSAAVLKSRSVGDSQGAVAIEYRGADGMNLPVEGAAECTFAVGAKGALTLVEAAIDGTTLSEGEVRAIRGELDQRT